VLAIAWRFESSSAHHKTPLFSPGRCQKSGASPRRTMKYASATARFPPSPEKNNGVLYSRAPFRLTHSLLPFFHMSFFHHPHFKRISRILTFLAGIVVFVAIMAWIGNAQDHANDPQALTVPVSDQDWSKGGIAAPVTIVEYSDFQCPACGAYYPVMKQLSAAFGDQIKIVYRNFPLTQLHPNAQLAAQAAEAAGIQGKFFDMHDVLFESQKEWSELSDPTETFVSYATALGLNVDQFRSDLTSSTVRAAVAEDVRSGMSANVSGTPTFFLNGVEIDSPQGLQPFTNLINEALAASVSTPAE
jgi:protein-disulfide isomerase